MLSKQKVLNSFISKGTFQAFVDATFELTQQKKSSYICFTNVHMLMESYNDKQFNQILNNADIATPDGRPVSLYMRLFDGIRQERVAGMDLVPALIAEANKRGAAVYFYGSTDDILEQIENKIRTDFPNVRLAGIYSPPFRALTEEEDNEIIRKINEAKPDLLFVALGCPKQEKWMAAHKDKVEACMLGVGQAFLTFIGAEKRLPKWARDFSLEWAYRLWLEPNRLWRRYLFTNSQFLWLVIKAFVQRKIFRMKA